MRRFLSRIHDTLRLVRCFTFSRLINVVWLGFTFLAARYAKTFIPTRGPLAVSVEPTTHCNLRCPECPSGLRMFSRPTGRLDVASFHEWAGQLRHTVVWMNLYFQGEPFLHPGLRELIAIAKKERFYTMISTNGHFLDTPDCRMVIESGLDRLVISLDGLDQESYAQYRVGGDVAKVIEGIDRLAAMKQQMGVRHPYLVVQCLVLRSNEHQVPELLRRFGNAGVDKIELKSAQFYHFGEGHPLIPSDGRYSRYHQVKEGVYTIKSGLPDHCRRLWTSAVITWDGLVVPCCFDKDAAHRAGSLHSENFRNIWKGKSLMDFRRAVFTNRQDVAICRNCNEGLKRT